MNKKDLKKAIWFIPILAMIIQLLGIMIGNILIPYTINDHKGTLIFCIFYIVCITIVILLSYLYIVLLKRYIKGYIYFTVSTIMLVVLFTTVFSYLISDGDMIITSIIIFSIQCLYFVPFYYCVYRFIVRTMQSLS